MPASPHSDQIAPLDIMTFNLRYASASAPHSWAERRPVTRKLLRGESPHLIGTQEGLYQQLRDIAHRLDPHLTRRHHQVRRHQRLLRSGPIPQ